MIRLPHLAILVALGAPAVGAGAVAGEVRAPAAGPLVTRQQLIDEAQVAHKLGDHMKAATLFQRAGEISMSPALGYSLALEQEEAGLLADSYANAQQCARDAGSDREARDRGRVLRDCQDLERLLAPRVGYVTVEIPDRPLGVDIAVAGQTAGKVVLGVPCVVTPGSVIVKATAPGRIGHFETVEVASGQTAMLKFDLVPVPDGSGPLTVQQKQEIRAHYERGNRAYDVGKCQEAIEEYEQIYEIDGDPAMLYNIGQAYRLSDDPEKALRFYRRYLLRSPDARNRDAVAQKIASLEQLLAQQRKTRAVAP